MRRLTAAHCAEDGERVEVTFDPAYEDGDNTSVGYGAYEVTNGPGGHQFLYDDVRMVARGTLNSINPAWLRISMNPATGNGGTCYGDSGGPNFLATPGRSPRSPSPATRSAARRTWSTGSTRRRRGRSCRST
ncbi:MAG TPA: hypothetical protein VD836_07530 [Solirubrobacteraceae bacterium]|nr:hypothetical protein [Solirubrobacteraceae bacterium]